MTEPHAQSGPCKTDPELRRLQMWVWTLALVVATDHATRPDAHWVEHLWVVLVLVGCAMHWTEVLLERWWK